MLLVLSVNAGHNVKSRKKNVWFPLRKLPYCSPPAPLHISGQADGSWEPSVKTLSVPIFRPILKAMRIEGWNSTLRFAQLEEGGNKNIKYFIPSSRNRNHNRGAYSRPGILIYIILYVDLNLSLNDSVPKKNPIKNSLKNKYKITFKNVKLLATLFCNWPLHE